MELSIEHNTLYTYDEPVFLQPHHLYFHPGQRAYLKLNAFSLTVQPDYDGLTERMDAENNIYHQVWFSGLHRTFQIQTKLKIAIKPINPFDFLREEGKSEDDPRLLLYKTPIINLSNPLTSWIREQRGFFGDETLTFISGVNREIGQNWNHGTRYQIGILTPDECFLAKAGSCRDLCWMLLAVLSHEKIPCRFVSGYAFNPELEEGHELHSWVDAWLPGAGWTGFDPSTGLLTDHFYIPISASYNPKFTLPVQGTLSGDANGEMKTELIIRLKE